MKKNEPGMAYNTKTLNRVFAFVSVLFLVVTVWMLLEDYIRPWKVVQIKGKMIKEEVLENQLKEAQAKIDAQKLAELEKKVEEAKAIVAEKSDAIAKVQKEIDAVKPLVYDYKIKNGSVGAKVSELGFIYGEAFKHDDEIKEKKLKKKYDKLNAEWAVIKDKYKFYQAEEKRLRKKMAGLEKEKTDAQKNIDDYTGTVNALKKAIEVNTLKNPVQVVRNLPFLDFLDPTLKIEQIVLDNLADDRFFQKVPKVDRCTTCHMFIDQKGYEDQPQPYSTHPRLELMLGAKSPHPIKKIGCTICHGGEGHRVRDFSAPVHMPQNEEQKLAWIEKYHWHAPHKVPLPQFPLDQVESQCIKCHKGVERIPGAPKVNKGIALIEENGCYACHKIEGWEHKVKPGPSLEKIKGKVTKEWAKNWIWDPKGFNKHARMPNFFAQSNNSRPDFMRKNVAEVNAMAEWLWTNMKGYKPFKKYTGGTPSRGKELITSVGCISCHGVDGISDQYNKAAGYKGPWLSGTGSKVNPDWLVSWLKKPSHYQEDTIMPSFRLSDREANDIASYLLSLKNKSFEKLKFAELDKEARDEILVTYFSAFDTQEGAKKKLGKMSNHERTMELGRRSIGKYGCYSCHNITGFEGWAPIGPELTHEGSKPLTQFGFNLQHDVPHTRAGWIKAHLINPRRWDAGMNKPFKDLTRMPNFYLSEQDAEDITRVILGFVSDYIPPMGVKRMSAHEKVVAEGEKVIYKYNCVGCHNIDGMGGDILKAYEDDINEGPPYLTQQGHRVKSDWLYHFLGNVHKIRPWLKVRMPSFNLSSEEKNKIVAYFQYKTGKVGTKTFEEAHKVAWLPGERKAALQLWENLACTSCHAEGFTNDEPSAPNLKYAKVRLRPTWIKEWFKNPQSFLPETVMPAFWEDGESQESEILGGDPEKQMNALIKLIMEFGKDEYYPPLPHNTGEMSYGFSSTTK